MSQSLQRELVEAVGELVQERPIVMTGPRRGQRLPALDGWRLTLGDETESHVVWHLRRGVREEIDVVVNVVDLEHMIVTEGMGVDKVGEMASYVCLIFQEVIAQYADEPRRVVLPRLSP